MVGFEPTRVVAGEVGAERGELLVQCRLEEVPGAQMWRRMPQLGQSLDLPYRCRVDSHHAPGLYGVCAEEYRLAALAVVAVGVRFQEAPRVRMRERGELGLVVSEAALVGWDVCCGNLPALLGRVPAVVLLA